MLNEQAIAQDGIIMFYRGTHTYEHTYCSSDANFRASLMKKIVCSAVSLNY